MEQETSANDPIPCANGCGFFGTPSNNNLCSRCYLDFLKKLQPKSSSTTPVSSSSAAAAAAAAVSPEKKKVEEPQQERATKQPPNRCNLCRKRVGITGFKCRCDQTFCALHRYPDQHVCVFDYKKAGRNQIARENPVVKAAKIHKI